MKADILHSKPVKKTPPLHRGLGLGDLAGFFGPAGLDGRQERKNGLGDWDREGLGNATLGRWEKNGFVVEVDALTGNGALLKPRPGGQPDLETDRHPARIFWKFQTNFLDLIVGQRRLYFFGS